ncbi:syndecan-1 isoform X1 [Canis lupus familiaris]|uniref:syndecan-1 isoform X1 n=1 Tax=Canis lupus familiaris TaxID=9615 RepID=UPI000BAA18B2|nr:syndecan-1 isoform X1 [Canis lupus familiaris]|eukprot:XP_022260187.1 syndecan-1 isoform X1 [Canis lupus familiaris]
MGNAAAKGYFKAQCGCCPAPWPCPGIPQMQIVATNVPPEDQDGSGDDSDNFSGSGAGALQDITLSQQTPSTWKDMALLTAMPTAQEPTGADDIDSSTSILLTREGPEGGEAVLVAEAEPGFTDREKETAHPPSETTPHPTTHRASTARATTAQGPATLHPHRDAQPDHHQISVLAEPSQLDPHTPRVEDGGPSATERAAEDGVSTQLPAGEGSGEQDFTFDVSGENTAGTAVEPDQRNQPPVDRGATGASQGLLDRKEVLGGVIAGGLVGLIFAVCLVGFMLYRMKKKDEGSYSLEEPKQANGGAYQKPSKQEEFYA